MKILKMFFSNLNPLYLGQILTDWALVFCKHPHSEKDSAIKSGVLVCAGVVIFGVAALWGAKMGVPPKFLCKNLWSNVFVKS